MLYFPVVYQESFICIIFQEAAGSFRSSKDLPVTFLGDTGWESIVLMVSKECPAMVTKEEISPLMSGKEISISSCGFLLIRKSESIFPSLDKTAEEDK